MALAQAMLCQQQVHAGPKATPCWVSPPAILKRSQTIRERRAIGISGRQQFVCRAEAKEKTKEIEENPAENRGEELENPDSDLAQKKDEAERLRAAEKFMKVGTGEAFCRGCGYEYKPGKGDPEYPISAGTYFTDLPNDWQCPICGAEKRTFENRAKEIAGFEENQGYGFGTNTMTSGQKSILIYGSLLAFFALFCAGYLLT